MPSHQRTRRFERDWKTLREADRDRFRVAFKRFNSELGAASFRPGLRVKRVEGTDSVFEMTWAPDGRATFEYDTPEDKGAHVIWRRIGPGTVLDFEADRGRLIGRKAGTRDVIDELYGSLRMDEPVDDYIERVRGR